MSTTMGRCRSCGAQVVWVKTAGGKNMPCNPEHTYYKQTEGGREKIVTPNGEVLSCTIDIDKEKATGRGYISHFATCPYANVHRRKAKTVHRATVNGRSLNPD